MQSQVRAIHLKTQELLHLNQQLSLQKFGHKSYFSCQVQNEQNFGVTSCSGVIKVHFFIKTQ